MGLNDLPNEVIVKIFCYLSIEDLGNWTKVSKRFRNVCLDKALPCGKMKNVFRKDMSQKDLEDSLAKKIKMIKFVFSKKAKKIDEIFTVDLTLSFTSNKASNRR